VTTATVTGQILSQAGVGLAGVQASWLPSDAYLVSIQSAYSDAARSFVLSGVGANARDWFAFELTGYKSIFQEFDVTSAAQQTLPAATLPTTAEAAALAQSFDVTLDPTRVVIIIPVAVTASSDDTSAALTVSTQPPLDVPVQYDSGEAIVFNAIPTDSYQVTVTRGTSMCVPSSQPEAVADNGSVEVRTISGFWTVAPTMVCP